MTTYTVKNVHGEPKECECGCGGRAKPGNRFLNGHHGPRKKLQPRLNRLMSKVVWNGDEDECWDWQGSKNVGGYGVIADGGGRKMVAHRASYEEFVGLIPEGLSLDHLCRNRGCVNPSHLEPVTHRENVLRGESPAAQFAARDCCPNGHPFDEENTYRWRGRRLCRACRRAESLARYHRKKEK